MRTTMNQTPAPSPLDQLPAFLDQETPAEDAPAAATTAATPAETADAPATPTAAAPKTGRGGLLAALAVLCGGGAGAAAAFPQAATAVGVLPATLALGGAVFAAAATLARRLAQLAETLAADAAERRAAEAALTERVEQFAAGRGDDGGGLDQVLLALQRQDEKTANLTKAVKIYGTPLGEIADQTSDLTAAMQQLHERLDALVARAAGPSIEPLTQALGRVEVGLAAVAQRLDDAETRKTLFRLEETTQKGLATLHELHKGDGLRQVGADLQARVDRATASLTEGLHRLGDGRIGDLESIVRDIQREMAGVATQVAQIGAAVKGGSRTTTMAPPTTTTAADAPAAPTAPTPTTEAGATTAGDGGGYQTGARSSGGRNVLGAIAKLRQMKG